MIMCPSCRHVWRPERWPLTAHERRAYEAIAAAIQESGQAPTLLELGRATGIKSKSAAHAVVMQIERKGWILRRPNAKRGLVLLGPSRGRASGGGGQ